MFSKEKTQYEQVKLLLAGLGAVLDEQLFLDLFFLSKILFRCSVSLLRLVKCKHSASDEAVSSSSLLLVKKLLSPYLLDESYSLLLFIRLIQLLVLVTILLVLLTVLSSVSVSLTSLATKLPTGAILSLLRVVLTDPPVGS